MPCMQRMQLCTPYTSLGCMKTPQSLFCLGYVDEQYREAYNSKLFAQQCGETATAIVQQLPSSPCSLHLPQLVLGYAPPDLHACAFLRSRQRY
ncbi:uncharacterized protein P174DRAFT_272911 [Aspergillus novofumigatus IBT 16806]|uniref:Uncharacterized protein n=1 Tax=Aspergillus novofumigatus (strain IBT 16806) TaxID=1392255 RepID=A0A2I1BZJ4_ASPN1|nr:uncharacterized protein P174DRAFT_272911 [Aspergillus novofumigatus IBT 16806]PKX90785.1 hypothetical protein P174DRAFT_272911 [Aspergillus novofumigatus IBT 16806]